MTQDERIALIREIERLRGSKVITFLTSLRQNVPATIADDCVRTFFEHLLVLPSRPVDKLDIFLVSNGGSGTVPWRLVALFREFAKSFNVLVPYRAYSAATLVALGANEIVMHPFGELGPIDPTVSNDYNPVDPATGRKVGISVEDVRAYVSFIKTTVGITHDDELIKAIEILAQKIHPLSLGNVERFVSQSRMVAKKILNTHMTDEADEHKIEDIVENMASKLFFHGHPINRKEAKNELKLQVKDDLQPELESAMWNLYKGYEEEFQNTVEFNPPSLITNAQQQHILQQQQIMQQQQQQQQQLPLNPQQQQILQTPPPNHIDVELLISCVESTRLSSKFQSRRRYTLVQMQQGMQMAQGIKEDILSQGWAHTAVAQPAAA